MNDTLMDTFGRQHDYLRISVTDRCNLRCHYCMPAQGFPTLPNSQILSYEEIVRFVRLMASWGLKKVRLTGGEPLVRKDLPYLIEQLSQIPGIEKIGLTTNGLLFAPMAQDLQNAGLSAVNLSLDSLNPARFEQIARRPGLDLVLASLEKAKALKFAELKVNAVVLKGVNDDELVDLAQLCRGGDLQMRFIEAMPFAANGWHRDALLSYEEILAQLSQSLSLIPLVDPDVHHPISQDFYVPELGGKIGIIASMTRSFCAGCERLRLQADGSLKACLFEPAQANIREALKRNNPADLALLVQETLWSKAWEHPPAVELSQTNLPIMTGIGG